jgi:hypothetical protein
MVGQSHGRLDFDFHDKSIAPNRLASNAHDR